MELTKQDIIQYLRTVGLLEWTIQDINNDIRNLDNERQQLFEKRSFKKQQYYPFSFCLKRFAISLLISVVIGFVVLLFWGGIIEKVLITLFPALDGMTADDNRFLAFLFNCLWGIPPLLLTIFLFLRSKGFKLLSGYIKSKKDNIVNSYDFNKQQNQRLQDAPNRDADIEYERKCLSNLVSKAEYDLEQAYEMDIIYSKYRNLNAVFSMYEYFLSGSVDTLKEAINKYDSESRMDKMISQLGEINETAHRIYDEMLYQTQLAEQSINLAQQQLEYAQATAYNTQQISNNTRLTALNTSLLILMKEREMLYRGY